MAPRAITKLEMPRAKANSGPIESLTRDAGRGTASRRAADPDRAVLDEARQRPQDLPHAGAGGVQAGGLAMGGAQ